ncbi:hypothetical protein P12x_000256 [Tundrisphaera lichenicola]|uniref:hypothetical protein n=1 Tax=Tundrisphaera lichenicola TaxID=2029860 RepID=UPI003EC0778E
MGLATRDSSTIEGWKAPVRLAWRHRWGLAAVAGLLAFGGLWAWWATQLWGLPDIGDPFDVAAFETFSVPDERNAFFEYRDASALTMSTWKKIRGNKSGPELEFPKEGWSKANSVWRDFLAQSGEALTIWRAGSEKPGFLYIHPDGLSFGTLLPVSQELRMLARLAILEGSRLEAEGDMAGAWGWYRAALRSSRHSGLHGFMIERLIGAAMHEDASKGLTRWASDPRVDAPLLRRALDEVIAIDAMTAPHSVALKLEYLVSIRSMGDPNLIGDVLVQQNTNEAADWCQELPISDLNKERIQEVRVLAANDRERSVRVSRLMMANWLAQVDKPPSRRARLYRADPPIYELDPDGPPESKAIPPEELSRWLDSSMLAARHFRFLSKYTPAIEKERVRQARLVVHLADQLYRREHGGTPPTSPEALVGPYLKALPEEFVVDP